MSLKPIPWLWYQNVTSPTTIYGRIVTLPYNTIRECSIINLLTCCLVQTIIFFCFLRKIGQSFLCIFRVIPLPEFQQHLKWSYKKPTHWYIPDHPPGGNNTIHKHSGQLQPLHHIIPLELHCAINTMSKVKLLQLQPKKSCKLIPTLQGFSSVLHRVASERDVCLH